MFSGFQAGSIWNRRPPRPVLGEKTNSKRTRVSSSPPLPVGKQGGGGGTHGHEADCGKDGAIPPQPPHLVTKAPISHRPNSHISHSYPPHSNDWSERGENCSYSHTPIPTPLTGVRYERKLPGDRSRAVLDRQGHHGPPPMPTDCLQSRDNDRYSSARWARIAGCPPTATGAPPAALAVARWRTSHVLPRCFAVPQGTHTRTRASSSPMPGLTSNGCDSYHQAWQSYAITVTVYTGSWSSYGHQSVRPAPTWYQPGQPLPGHHCGARQQWDYTPSRPNWHSSSPQAQALAWEHANGSGRVPSSRQPSLCL